MSGGGKVPPGGKVGEKGFDLRHTHFFGVAFVMKENVLTDPVHVGLASARGVVFGFDHVADLVEEFSSLRRLGGWVFHDFFLRQKDCQITKLIVYLAQCFRI